MQQVIRVDPREPEGHLERRVLELLAIVIRVVDHLGDFALLQIHIEIWQFKVFRIDQIPQIAICRNVGHSGVMV